MHMLRRHRLARPFRKPVEWERLGLVDYPDIIAAPCDLQTIYDELLAGNTLDPPFHALRR